MDNIELVEFLISYGVNINYKNTVGTTASMVAYINSHYNIAHFLLENEANPNIHEYTELMYLLDDFELEIINIASMQFTTKYL